MIINAGLRDHYDTFVYNFTRSGFEFPAAVAAAQLMLAKICVVDNEDYTLKSNYTDVPPERIWRTLVPDLGNGKVSDPILFSTEGRVIDFGPVSSPDLATLARAFQTDLTEDDIVGMDFLQMLNWMVHADVPNSNRMAFADPDLQDSAYRDFSVYTPCVIDINHQGQPIMGISFSAMYGMDDEAGVNGLAVRSVLWAWGPYKDTALALYKGMKEGIVKFSMVCTCEYIQCSDCGAIGRWGDAMPCVHLSNMDQYPGAFMYLRHPRFLANSIILPPFSAADSDAKPIVLANNMKFDKENVSNILAGIDNLSNTNSKLVKASSEGGSMKTLEELQAALDALQAEHDVSVKSVSDLSAKIETYKSLQADLDGAIAKIVVLEAGNTSLMATNEQLVADRDRLQKELEASAKNTEDLKVAARIAQLGGESALPEAQKEHILTWARTLDDQGWDNFVTLISTKTSADPHLAASFSFGLPPGAGGVDAFSTAFPNIAAALKKK